MNNRFINEMLEECFGVRGIETKDNYKTIWTTSARPAAFDPDVMVKTIKDLNDTYKYGFKVRTSKLYTRAVKCKWRKKKRLNKKFVKRFGQRVVQVPTDTVYMLGDEYLICHPTTLKRFDALLNKKKEGKK